MCVDSGKSAKGDRMAESYLIRDADVGTLRNWEQGRREPTGPAKALLVAIRNDPKNVLKALAT